jgi:hypothetical protein
LVVGVLKIIERKEVVVVLKWDLSNIISVVDEYRFLVLLKGLFLLLLLHDGEVAVSAPAGPVVEGALE